MKNFKASYYMLAVFIAGVIALVYFSQDQTQETEPKIKLSYFKSNMEVAESIYAILQQDQMHKQAHYWFGVEPGAPGELNIYKEIKSMIEKENGSFDFVYVDRELKLSPEDKSLFGETVIREIKEDWGNVAKDLQTHANEKILVITASIYSTNMIPQNPIYKMKQANGMSPVTLSMGFFAAKMEEESKNIFRCVTDDQEGVSGWGCVVVNKARGQRRKIDITKINPPASKIVGLMDKTGDRDYMILVR
jgi:hypothetical protein